MEGSSALCALSVPSPDMCDAPIHACEAPASQYFADSAGGSSPAAQTDNAPVAAPAPPPAEGVIHHSTADTRIADGRTADTPTDDGQTADGPSFASAASDPPRDDGAEHESDAAVERPAMRLMVDGSGAPRGVRPEQVIEALLFASDRPLSAAKLADLVGSLSVNETRLHVAALNDKYTMGGMAFRIESIAGGFQMMTLPDYQGWLNKLARQRAETRLSGAALETLSIVAYKQPVIRADIEAIRGVASGEVLNRLREMGLVKIVGRAEVVGRPMLYGTTRKFLDVFGMASLEDLPPMETLSLRRPVPPSAGEESIREPRAAAGA